MEIALLAVGESRPDSSLRVSVVIQALLGPLTVPIGAVDGTDSWPRRRSFCSLPT